MDYSCAWGDFVLGFAPRQVWPGLSISGPRRSTRPHSRAVHGRKDNMRRAALLLICLCLCVLSGFAQTATRRRPRIKKHPAPTRKPDDLDRVLSTVPTFDEFVGWRLATISTADADDKHTNVYYDRSRITRPSSGIVNAWLKFVDDKRTDELKSNSARLLEFDCAARKWRT